MRHLSRDQMLAAAEDPSTHPTHLDTCQACRTHVEELRQVLALAAADDVPEPSPLFWNHFSDRVREAVVAEPAPRLPYARLNFASTVSLAAALAIIVIGVMVTMRTARSVNSAVNVPVTLPEVADSSGDLALSNDDSTWAVMGDLASQLNWEEATEAGLTTGPDAADRVIAHMSEEEQRDVVELLQSELRKANRL
jgi:hypothetical protein